MVPALARDSRRYRLSRLGRLSRLSRLSRLCRSRTPSRRNGRGNDHSLSRTYPSRTRSSRRNCRGNGHSLGRAYPSRTPSRRNGRSNRHSPSRTYPPRTRSSRRNRLGLSLCRLCRSGTTSRRNCRKRLRLRLCRLCRSSTTSRRNGRGNDHSLSRPYPPSRLRRCRRRYRNTCFHLISATPVIAQGQGLPVDRAGKLSVGEIATLPENQRVWTDNVFRALKLQSKGSQARVLAGAIATTELLRQANSPDLPEATRLLTIVTSAGNPPWKDMRLAMAATDAKMKLELLSIPPAN